MGIKCHISPAPFFLLIETSGSICGRHKLDAFLEEVYEGGVISYGTVAEDSIKAANTWGLRERQVESGVRVD